MCTSAVTTIGDAEATVKGEGSGDMVVALVLQPTYQERPKSSTREGSAQDIVSFMVRAFFLAANQRCLRAR